MAHMKSYCGKLYGSLVVSFLDKHPQTTGVSCGSLQLQVKKFLTISTGVWIFPKCLILDSFADLPVVVMPFKIVELEKSWPICQMVTGFPKFPCSGGYKSSFIGSLQRNPWHKHKKYPLCKFVTAKLIFRATLKSFLYATSFGIWKMVTFTFPMGTIQLVSSGCFGNGGFTIRDTSTADVPTTPDDARWAACKTSI